MKAARFRGVPGLARVDNLHHTRAAGRSSANQLDWINTRRGRHAARWVREFWNALAEGRPVALIGDRTLWLKFGVDRTW